MEDRAKLEELKDIIDKLESSINNCTEDQYIRWDRVLEDIVKIINR